MVALKDIRSSSAQDWAVVALYALVVVELLADSFGILYTSTAKEDGSLNITARSILVPVSFGVLSCSFCGQAKPSNTDLSHQHDQDEVLPEKAPPVRSPKREARAGSVRIHGAASRGDVKAAEQIWREMERAGIKPDVVSYNGIIHACAKAGEPLRAEKWIKTMQERGVEPDVLTYTSVICAYAKNATKESAARAEYWFNRILEANVRPNAYVFSAIINAHAKANDVQSAVRLFDFMIDIGETGSVFVYTSVLDACARVGDAQQALRTLERMGHDGVTPNIYSYAAVARALAVHGDFFAVERLRQEMEGKGVLANQYFIAALVLAYGNAKPPQPLRARAAVIAAISDGIPVEGNYAIFRSLAPCCGKRSASALIFGGKSVTQAKA